MYREILVDHTSFHALQERGIDSRRISFATRQLLQLVENILLADTVWLTDTVTPGSMQVTAKTLEVFEKHGLNDARSEGKIRVARFTDSTLREVCERAAPRVFNIVQNIQGDDLLMPGSQLKYALQPAGAQSINYDRIRSLYLGSEEAEDYIGASIEARGWLPVSTLPLLHPDLWEWFQDLTASINDPSALRSFSTICRWQMNVEAARRLSVNASTIDYTPALGRSVTIEKVVRHSAASKLRSLESQINRTLWDMRNVGEHLKQMGPTIDFPIPLIGLWVILGLPERCTQDHLAERLVELQKHSWIRSLRDFIASADEDSIALVIKEVGDELRHSYLSGQAATERIEAKIRIPLYFAEVNWKKEIAFSPRRLSTSVRRWFMLHPVSTMFTGIVEYADQESLHGAFRRVESLLSTSASTSSPSGSHRGRKGEIRDRGKISDLFL